MNILTPLLSLALAVLCLGLCHAAEYGLMGYWPFDSDLQDASGREHHAEGETPRFAEGTKGMALDPDWKTVSVPSSPDLQLFSGITIDCWVLFGEQPKSYEQIIIKDKEYQLRVDAEKEGGQFAFFVHLDGWEPRVRGIVPEAGRWYHLVAKWTGTEMSLEVNGEKTTSARRGVPIPTDNPVQMGAISGRLDELKIVNPILQSSRELMALADAAPDAARVSQTSFGGANGWAGWRAFGGASMNLDGGAIAAEFPSSDAILVNPNLNVDLSGLRYVCVDIDAPQAQLANLMFIADRGPANIAFPVWNSGRTTIISLANCRHWIGKLKLLAISFPDAAPQEAVVRNVWISREPEGRPFLYVRSLAPGRAKLRAGREERVIATVRNLGRAATGVRARLTAPEGIRILDEAEKPLTEMPLDATEMVEWRVQAQRPVEGEIKVTLSADDFDPTNTSMAVSFTPPLNLPKADYVPPPRPAKTKYLTLMHYCPLWKEGTHYGWERIEPWPERRPAIGWYDEGTPEVADWHIKYCLEHGIQGFIYCWYRKNFNPEIEMHIGHAIHDGLLNARYLDQFKFVIMWENGCAKGVKNREDMLDNLLPFWMENYFKHPSYVKIDNKPLLYVWRPERVAPELGGSENTRKVFDEMREACKQEGFDGLWIVGCVGSASKGLLERMAREGWDASSAYGLWGPTDVPEGRDIEGITTIDHASSLLGQEEIWRGKKDIGALPDIVDVMMGWDPRPWHGKQTRSYIAGAAPEHFKAACIRAKALVDATPGNGLDKRIVVFDNWNEFGEGHYLEPCSGFGFGFVDAIKEVFCEDTEPCLDITPADVGLEPPEHVYLKRRELMGGFPGRTRKVVGNLIGWWSFEEDDDSLALDSSNCGFHGLKQGFVSAEGRVGKGFLCKGGSVVVGSNRLFWPSDGITVELWFKTDVAEQSDRWMVNTIGAASTGYRLGLNGGKLCWQVPQTTWSHTLACPEPAELGKWTHVAATCDNRVMRIFVNGALEAELERRGPLTPSGANLCIGSYAAGHPRAFFEGVLDEVKVYDRALSAEEIRVAASVP